MWLPVNFDHLALQNSISKIQACLEDISQWMTVNKLHINPCQMYNSISFQGSTIQPSKSAKNLGVMFHLKGIYILVYLWSIRLTQLHHTDYTLPTTQC